MFARSLAFSILLLAALTSMTRAADQPTVGNPTYAKRSWPIADLLGPAIEAGKAAPIPNPAGQARTALRKIIMEIIAPRSWSAEGAQASVGFSEEGNELIVCQTAQNLEQVEELLDAMRRLYHDLDTAERFEYWFQELWEARHDRPNKLVQFAWASIQPVYGALSIPGPVSLIQRLPVMEPPRFWAAIVNSPQAPIACRRECAVQLFRRHVRPGMKLSELAALLGHPVWLRKNHVCDLKQVAGSFFVDVGMTSKDSTFSVYLFPEGDLKGTIFLRVAGQMTTEEFVRILREGKRGTDSSILALSVWQP